MGTLGTVGIVWSMGMASSTAGTSAQTHHDEGNRLTWEPGQHSEP